MPDLTCAGDGLVGYQHSSMLAQCITSNYKSCSCYYSSGIAASKWPTSLADKSTAFISSRSRIHPARKVKGTAHLAVRDGPRKLFLAAAETPLEKSCALRALWPTGDQFQRLWSVAMVQMHISDDAVCRELWITSHHTLRGGVFSIFIFDLCRAGCVVSSVVVYSQSLIYVDCVCTGSAWFQPLHTASFSLCKKSGYQLLCVEYTAATLVVGPRPHITQAISNCQHPYSSIQFNSIAELLWKTLSWI